MPARLADLKRGLKSFSVEILTPHGGSHWRAERDGKTYPIPAHNGEKTMISDQYLRGVCRCFGLDLNELKHRL